MEQLARVQLCSLPAIGIDLAAMSDDYPGDGSSALQAKLSRRNFSA
jgi:hypothetical protein